MPWKECQKMDEKLRFVSRHLEGESISQLCREFGISRVTGHKLVERYRQNGLEAFSDRSRRPYRMANQLPLQVEALIVQIKNEFPTWGAPKIRERLLARYPEIKTPAKSTVHAVLERNLLVKHKRANARPNLDAKLKHSVLMAGLCRDNLQNVPVFNDFPECIEAEDVYASPVLVRIGGSNLMTMKYHQL